MLDNVVIVSVNAEMVMMSYNVTTKFSQSRTVVYYYTCIHMWVLYMIMCMYSSINIV